MFSVIAISRAGSFPRETERGGERMAEDLGSLCADLSSVVPSVRTERAATRFLDLPDPSDALGRVYRFLVWQRTLRIALDHLETAGADLERLTIPEEAFRSTFPAGYRPAWDLDLLPPITARTLIEVLDTHKRLLGAPVLHLVDDGVDDFALVSGRAYEARYPDYRHRAEFDTDLVAPDFAAAARITSTLQGHGLSLDSVSVRAVGDRPDATVEIRDWVHGHRISVGVLVGGYHRHRSGIAAGADEVSWRGRQVRVARAEDLLVMLAARIHRKGLFAFVNVNDAAVILDRDGDRIDWDTVVVAARTAGLAPTLAVVVRRAEQVLGRDVAPRHALEELTPSARSRALRKLAERVTESDLQYPDTSTSTLPGPFRMLRARPQRRPDTVTTLTPVGRARKRLWRATTRRGSAGDVRVAALIRIQRKILQAQLRRIAAGRPPRRRDATLTRLRTRCGAFCEVASPVDGDERCLAELGGGSGSSADSTALHDVAGLFGPADGPHDCTRLRFDLATPYGA